MIVGIAIELMACQKLVVFLGLAKMERPVARAQFLNAKTQGIRGCWSFCHDNISRASVMLEEDTAGDLKRYRISSPLFLLRVAKISGSIYVIQMKDYQTETSFT